jgi:hypothetical protein
MPQEYRDAAERLGETNDCTVRALAAVSGLAYADAHELMAACGRKPRQGAHFLVAMDALGYELGRNLRRVNPVRPFRPTPGRWGSNGQACNGPQSAMTVRTLARHPLVQSGKWFAITCNHVLAIVDGQVLDWSEGRLNRVTALYLVED